jgi:hypothetical protein
MVPSRSSFCNAELRSTDFSLWGVTFESSIDANLAKIKWNAAAEV